jgi:hypothetical protein
MRPWPSVSLAADPLLSSSSFVVVLVLDPWPRRFPPQLTRAVPSRFDPELYRVGEENSALGDIEPIEDDDEDENEAPYEGASAGHTLKPDEPAATGNADRLRSAKNVQLFEYTAKMRFHGGFTDVKTDTDLFVTFSSSQELEYIQLSAGKSFGAQAGSYLVYKRRREAGLTSIYPAYAVQQFFASSVLQEIGFGPCFNRPQNLSVRFIRG